MALISTTCFSATCSLSGLDPAADIGDVIPSMVIDSARYRRRAAFNCHTCSTPLNDSTHSTCGAIQDFPGIRATNFITLLSKHTSPSKQPRLVSIHSWINIVLGLHTVPYHGLLTTTTLNSHNKCFTTNTSTHTTNSDDDESDCFAL